MWAMKSISSVMTPWRAKCIWEKFPVVFSLLRRASQSAPRLGDGVPLLPLPLEVMGTPELEIGNIRL